MCGFGGRARHAKALRNLVMRAGPRAFLVSGGARAGRCDAGPIMIMPARMACAGPVTLEGFGGAIAEGCEQVQYVLAIAREEYVLFRGLVFVAVRGGVCHFSRWIKVPR